MTKSKRPRPHLHELKTKTEGLLIPTLPSLFSSRAALNKYLSENMPQFAPTTLGSSMPVRLGLKHNAIFYAQRGEQRGMDLVAHKSLALYDAILSATFYVRPTKKAKTPDYENFVLGIFARLSLDEMLSLVTIGGFDLKKVTSYNSKRLQLQSLNRDLRHNRVELSKAVLALFLSPEEQKELDII